MSIAVALWLRRNGSRWALRIERGREILATLVDDAELDDAVTLADQIRAARLFVEPRKTHAKSGVNPGVN